MANNATHASVGREVDYHTFRFGERLQNHNIPNARPGPSKRAASAEPTGRIFQETMHRKEVRAYDIAEAEVKNMDDRIRNRDRILAEKHQVLREIYNLTTPALVNPSFAGLLQLVDDIRDKLRPALLIGRPEGAPPAGNFTIAIARPQNQRLDFNDSVPFLEPGNQCVSPETDEPLFDGVLNGLKNDVGVRKAHNALPRGEIGTKLNQFRIWKKDKGWDVQKHGLMNWDAVGTKKDFPVDLISPTRPEWSPITPPGGPQFSRMPPPPARTPSPPSSPSPPPPPAPPTNGPTGSRLNAGPRGRKRKAADELPPRTKYARVAKEGEKRYG